MGKVQILAVLTMDGCHASELYSKADKVFCLDHCGINEIRENALYHITPDYSISMLDEWRKDKTDICYLAETMPDNADYPKSVIRMSYFRGFDCKLLNISILKTRISNGGH